MNEVERAMKELAKADIPSNEKVVVTEEDHPEKEWFEQAKRQTLATLPEFIRHLMNDYSHDYGTVVHAVAASAIAAAWAADHEPRGGITGFQAGFVMWDFIKQWSKPDNKTGLRLIDYDKMLYPQDADRFEPTMSSATWKKIQEEATRLLKEEPDSHPDVIAHWRSIVAGHVPFGYSVEED